jgi:CheY-like chemotaxis protein
MLDPPDPYRKPRLRVLLVEDEIMVAMLVESLLEELGCQIIGPIGRVDHALERVGEGGIDLAILDINVNGRHSYPIAGALADRGIPFIFSTGYGRTVGSQEFEGRPTLQKPYRLEDLRAAIECAAGPAAAPHVVCPT